MARAAATRAVALVVALALLVVASESSDPSYGMDAELDSGEDSLDAGDGYGLGEGKDKEKEGDAGDGLPGGPNPHEDVDPIQQRKDEEMAAANEPAVEPEPPTVEKIIGKIATMQPPGPLIPQSENEYVKIPHFEFKGTPENVENKLACQKKCGGREECRSYSWNEQKKQCFWSTGSLRYGAFWNFYSKEYEYNAFGQFEPTKEFLKFKGMFAIDEDQNMVTKEDKSVDDCKEICNMDDKCMSFSYHEGTHACLMGVSKVSYADGWDYFERNRAPKEIGGAYRLYPQRLDSYHKELRDREKTSLGIFAERDAKTRKQKVKAEKHIKKSEDTTIARKKRLDKEMKQKEFSGEQQRKKEILAKAQEKEDLKEAQARGKFDEAFHKQSAINKELLHKKGMEGAVKSSVIQRIHEHSNKGERKMQVKLAKLTDDSLKRLQMKIKETESKAKLKKLRATQRAIGMKKAAFALVSQERQLKSGMGFKEKKKDNIHSMKKLKGKTYIAKDDYEQAHFKEMDLKRQIKGEKSMHEVHRKLILEKQEKGDAALKERNQKQGAGGSASTPKPQVAPSESSR